MEKKPNWPGLLILIGLLIVALLVLDPRLYVMAVMIWFLLPVQVMITVGIILIIGLILFLNAGKKK